MRDVTHDGHTALLHAVGNSGWGGYGDHIFAPLSCFRPSEAMKHNLLRALLHSFISSVQISKETSLSLNLLKTTQARDLIAVEECTL